jgi:hypothetical protein
MTSPISPHTDLTSVVGQYLFNRLLNNKYDLGLNDVFYGNHNNVPQDAIAVVIPGPKIRTLAGVSAPGGRVQNELNVFIDVMTQKVLIGESAGRLATDQLAETVEHYIHQDTTLGGNIIHGFVNRWDPGQDFILQSEFRVVRMTFTGISKTYLSV